MHWTEQLVTCCKDGRAGTNCRLCHHSPENTKKILLHASGALPLRLPGLLGVPRLPVSCLHFLLLSVVECSFIVGFLALLAAAFATSLARNSVVSSSGGHAMHPKHSPLTAYTLYLGRVANDVIIALNAFDRI